jgi:hypothetical protein
VFDLTTKILVGVRAFFDLPTLSSNSWMVVSGSGMLIRSWSAFLAWVAASQRFSSAVTYDQEERDECDHR